MDLKAIIKQLEARRNELSKENTEINNQLMALNQKGEKNNLELIKIAARIEQLEELEKEK